MNVKSGTVKPSLASPAAASTDRTPDGERIAKVIARAGICSRREAEKLIEDGRVAVNGKTIKSPALNITGGETILIDGKVLPAQEPTRLWRYHKPAWTRRYRVRAWGRIVQADLDKLKSGLTVEGVRYGPIDAVIDKVQGSNVWLTVSLKEGKNREVKRVLAALGLHVNRLIRLSFGPFQIGDLEPGDIKQIPNRVLMDQLGSHAAAFERKAGKQKTDGQAAGAQKARVAENKKPGLKKPDLKKPAGKPGGTRAKQKTFRAKKADASGNRKAPYADRRRKS